jgi:hypothetical protein
MHIIRCSVFASPLPFALLRLSFLLQRFSAAALHPWSHGRRIRKQKYEARQLS